MAHVINLIAWSLGIVLFLMAVRSAVRHARRAAEEYALYADRADENNAEFYRWKDGR